MSGDNRIRTLPTDAFPLIVQHALLHGDFAVHAHEFTELVVILGGEGLHLLGEDAYPLVAGDVFVIQGAQEHGFSQMRRLRLANVQCAPDRLPLLNEHLYRLPGYHALFALEPAARRRHQFASHLHIEPDALAMVEELLRHLEDECRERRSGYQTMAIALFLELIVYLARHYASDTSHPTRALLQIGAVLSRMEAEYMEPLTLEEFADTALMSVTHLLRVFKEATGRSPIDYLIALRLRHAATLLHHTALPITTIAAQVGIPDSNYFSRLFRAGMGVSPREYRKGRGNR